MNSEVGQRPKLLVPKQKMSLMYCKTGPAHKDAGLKRVIVELELMAAPERKMMPSIFNGAGAGTASSLPAA